jgi:ATP-dependent DNA helicase RecG
MSVTIEQFNTWLNQPENERFEFKEAKNSFPSDRLAKLCAAMANEGGGRIILGVTDKLPRQVVGSAALPNLGATCSSLTSQLQIRITGQQLQHPDGNVYVLDVPARPLGVPIRYKGVYLVKIPSI